MKKMDINKLEKAIEHYKAISELLRKDETDEEKLHESYLDELRQDMNIKKSQWFYYTYVPPRIYTGNGENCSGYSRRRGIEGCEPEACIAIAENAINQIRRTVSKNKFNHVYKPAIMGIMNRKEIENRYC